MEHVSDTLYETYAGLKAKNTAVGIRHDGHVAPSIHKSWY
jgi:hypothetical protein